MLVKSTRFGPITASDADIIVMPHGLIGYEDTRHWLILADAENSDIAWLQSAAQPQVALPLVSPRKFVPDYKVTISQRQIEILNVRPSDRIFIMLVVSKSGKSLTVNLRGPILINLTQRLAVQCVLNEPLPLAMPLTLPSSSISRAAA
jgi:flagellar assembly factor FliW